MQLHKLSPKFILKHNAQRKIKLDEEVEGKHYEEEKKELKHLFQTMCKFAKVFRQVSESNRRPRGHILHM